MSWTTRLFIGFQYLVPQHLISRAAGWLANTEIDWIKKPFTRWFANHYQVNLDEALEPDLSAYRTFNDFFTRELKPGARPIAEQSDAIVSPADGVISQIGTVHNNSLIQAKGREYSVTELLGGDQTAASQFHGGHYAVIYLSPKDYHRVHMPLSGKLISMTHVPGDLFSVNEATADNVPRLFARNERAVCLFETDAGPMAVILVGAMIVASIELSFHGQVTPAPRSVQTFRYGNTPEICLQTGEELGRFKLGSTAIVLLPEQTSSWLPQFNSGSPVNMGIQMGQLTPQEAQET